MVLAWIAAAAALLPQALRAPERMRVSSGILGSESAAVDEALEHRLASPFATSALLVMTGLPAPDRPEGRAILAEAVAELRTVRGVRQTLSYVDYADPLLVGRGGTIVVLGLDPGVERVDRLVPALREATARLEARLRQRAPGIALRLTGEGPINYDIWRTSADDTAHAERRTLPLTLVLLAIAFGAAAAALLPVVSGALAVSLSLGVLSLVALRMPVAILALNVVSMVGLALGIDYALLSVSRFRESLAAGEPPAEAARTAARHAGATIALSGLPVAIGFLALLLVPLDELRSAALGGLVVTFVSVLLAATLLPALLGWLGPRLEAGRFWRRDSEAERARYRRWASFVVARPGVVLALALPPLLLLAAQGLRLDPAEPHGSWLPAATESARAEDDLAAMGRRGVALRAAACWSRCPRRRRCSRSRAGRRAFSWRRHSRPIPGWRPSARCAACSASAPRATPPRSCRPWRSSRRFAKRSFLAEEGDAFLLEVIPREELDGRARIGLVARPAAARRVASSPGFPAPGWRSAACRRSPPTTRPPERGGSAA